jgi:manganese transport protein
MDSNTNRSASLAECELDKASSPVNFHKRFWSVLPLFGSAFVVSIAYVDPGNFATNIAAGASHGYLLLWVVLLANLIGIWVQTQSAKLGLATGRDLPELCREYMPQPVVYGLWIIAELVAVATDLAEFIGAAIGLNLLFGIPLFVAGLMTGVVSFGILALQRRGYRRFEVAIGAMLGLVLLGFLYDTLEVHTNWGAAAHGFVPSFDGSDSVLLACGILGATVMPHVIYLHSALTKDRVVAKNDAETHRNFGFLRLDVVLAMTVAGVVNILMLIVAASLFHNSGHAHVGSLEAAHAGFTRLVGGGAALAFASALLASGFASSSVGTFAGQVIMDGFIDRSIPLVLRRLLTMTPALVVLAIGLNPSRSLVISQVVLSFGIPFALIPLVWLTSKSDLMGTLVNRSLTTVMGGVLAFMIVMLNVFLLYQTLVGVL